MQTLQALMGGAAASQGPGGAPQSSQQPIGGGQPIPTYDATGTAPQSQILDTGMIPQGYPTIHQYYGGAPQGVGGHQPMTHGDTMVGASPQPHGMPNLGVFGQPIMMQQQQQQQHGVPMGGQIMGGLMMSGGGGRMSGSAALGSPISSQQMAIGMPAGSGLFASQAQPPAQASPQVMPPVQHVHFRVGKHCFSLPGNVVKTEKFQQSSLGALINNGTLPDGTEAEKTAQGEFLVENREATNFALMVDHLLGRKPLESYTFSTVTSSYQRLVSELDYWKLDGSVVELPKRLWTASRWSDLTGFYVIADRDLPALQMHPVAVQLDEGTIQTLKVLDRVLPTTPTPMKLHTSPFNVDNGAVARAETKDEAEEDDAESEDQREANGGVRLSQQYLTAAVALEECQAILPIDVALSQVVGLYHHEGYMVVLVDYDKPIPAPKALFALQHVSFQHQMAEELARSGTIPAEPTVLSAPQTTRSVNLMLKYGNLTLAASALGYTSVGSEGLANPTNPASVQGLVIRLPHTDKIITHDVSPHDRFPPPTATHGASEVYPFAFRKFDRHYIWLTPTFGLEIQELRDGITGVSKVRASSAMFSSSAHRIVGKLQYDFAVSNGASPHHVVTAGSSGFFGSSGKIVKETWLCYHPTLGVRYSDGLKWMREFEAVKLRFFPWGTLVVGAQVPSSTTPSPFAILAVEQSETRRIYGETIFVNIKNSSGLTLNREDFDVAVTPTMDRVFLLACNQVASQAITPTANKVDFEVSISPGGRLRLKLVHIDVPEGAPRGKSLRNLYLLGMYAEFDVATGIYYQSEVCSSLCAKYKTPGG